MNAANNCKTLEQIVKRLRTPEGIVDFFYESGQVGASTYGQPFYPQNLFISIEKNGRVRSQIRIEEVGSGQRELPWNNEKTKEVPHHCIEMVYHPEKAKWRVKPLVYGGSFWSDINNKLPLDEAIAQGKVSKWHLENTQIGEIASFVKETLTGKLPLDGTRGNWKIDDEYYPCHKLAQEVGGEYLKWYETFARVQAPFRHKAIDGKAENPEMERIHRMIDTALNKVHHNLRSQYRFSVLLMAHDAKRYTEEIARHLRV